MLGLSQVLLLVAASTSRFSGLFLTIGSIGAFTAIYVLTTGRRSWAVIPTRKIASVVLAGALVAVFVGSSLAPASFDANLASTSAQPTATATPSATPSPTPSPTPLAFNVEAPADPATSTPEPDAASIVLADTSGTDTTAVALLATLPIKGRAPKTGYDRSGSFGTAWLDVDQNGCDTRNDILARDLTNIAKQGGCRVVTGTLTGPYTGKTINFVRGTATSSLVQIDHVVALSNAWQTGAQQLSQAQRVSLANDPLNLLALDGRTNSSKGDGDTATWLPPMKPYRCAYVARQISVKATYGLWVTQAEHDAMTRILTACPDERATASVFAPPPAPVVVVPVPVAGPAPMVVVPVPVAVEPAPVEPVAPAPASAYYKNCDAARAAGAAPVHTGDDGYGRHLDRDGDGVGVGVGCES
ncbi:HNH endonuclease family protein [Cryobacterium sp. TMS1-20-1]|uniref:HNH endonuclease family protein n=1 Tax=Cryobacterium sp. TMS1-20-1 TaxID=1259223 RepID=UPI001F5429B3|nr:HNH endonuclease family protein [Cryobacterium sp. TMS1-20-1]